MERPRGPRGELPPRPRACACETGSRRSHPRASPWVLLGLLGVSIARVRPVVAPSRSTATLAAVLVRRSWWRAALGGGPIGARMRARERARSPPPGLLRAGKPQQGPAGQAAPLLLENSSHSRLADCSKLASLSTASIWGHLNRRRRPQARSRTLGHEILTASMD